MQVSKIAAAVLFTTLIGAQAALASTSAPNSTLESTTASSSGMFQSFSVGRNSSVRVLQVESGRISAGQELKLSRGSDITVLATDKDAKYGKILRIGVDGNSASDVWVRATDLLDARLERSDIDSSVDPLSNEENASSISIGNGLAFNIDQVEDAKKMTYCYRFVKQYLFKEKLVPVYLAGGSAWMAASQLPKYGYRESGRNQYNAALGDICVYRGGNGNNGHIEIKRPAGWWYGYGYHAPISLRSHQLIDCFAK